MLLEELIDRIKSLSGKGIHIEELPCDNVKSLSGYCLDEAGNLKGINFSVNEEEELYSFEEVIEWLRPYKDTLEILSVGFFDKIRSLEPLEDFKKLKWLEILGKKISDAQALAQLYNLEYLSLEDFELIKKLSLPESLKTLFLDYTREVNLSALIPLSKLETLSVTNSKLKISELKKLEKLSSLKSLTISFEQFKLLNSSFLNTLEELNVQDILIKSDWDLEKFEKIDIITKPKQLLLDIQLENLRIIKVEDILDVLWDNQNLTSLNLWTTGFFYRKKDFVWNSLEDISHFQNLETLRVSELPIKDLSPIAGLKNLKFLLLSGLNFVIDRTQEQIEPDFDFSFIRELQNLGILWLNGVGLKDLSQLGYHPGIKDLDISHNFRVENLSLLPELFPNLEVLILHSLDIDTLEPLTHLKNLKYVDLSFTNIKDASALEKLKHVKIDLACSNIEPCE